MIITTHCKNNHLFGRIVCCTAALKPHLIYCICEECLANVRSDRCCSLAINLIGCLSPQDRDFCLLRPEDPLFQTFSGETLRYKGKEPLYPFFINECAYYEKGIAVSLARKRRVMIPAVRVQTEQEQEQQANEQGFASEEEE